MKITLIRHGKVNMDWKKRYTSAEYDDAWERYDDCDIFPITKHYEVDEDAKVFVTGFKRTQETAKQFLGVDQYEIIESLADEVPLKSYKDSLKRHRRGYMNFRGRLQWYLPSHRQEERRKATFLRAYELIRFLEQQTDDAVVVMHGFFLRAMCFVLKKSGYHVSSIPRFRVPNLVVVEAVKRTA